MLSILDRYILKRYIGTFTLLLLLFIPIGITVNLAEKIDKILQSEAPFIEDVEYYIFFTMPNTTSNSSQKSSPINKKGLKLFS